jgi:hypothetical protein
VKIQMVQNCEPFIPLILAFWYFRGLVGSR